MSWDRAEEQVVDHDSVRRSSDLETVEKEEEI